MTNFQPKEMTRKEMMKMRAGPEKVGQLAGPAEEGPGTGRSLEQSAGFATDLLCDLGQVTCLL